MIDLDEAIRELYFALYSKGDNFYSQLYRLIMKADNLNRMRLSAGFPAEVLAWSMWHDAMNEAAFFAKYGIGPKAKNG